MSPVAPPTNTHVNALRRQGYKLVAGMDEVGRGCFAGPVTVAAVILPPRLKIAGVRDSKLLSPARRRVIANIIKYRALAIGIGWASAVEIDELGLTAAIRQAGTRALADLGAYDAVLLDGSFNYLGDALVCQTLVRADQLSQSVAAASVVAKVARDSYMTRLSRRFPNYGFDAHKGYGTPVHRTAIVKYGLTDYHRRTWLSAAPITSAIA